VTDPDLARLGRYVAERQDRALERDAASESTRRYLAEHAARARSERGGKGRDVATRGLDDSAARARPWLRLALAALLVVLGLVGLKEVLFSGPALSFTIGASGESGVLRAWASAPEGARLPIRFSDGTLIELEPRARARVVELGRFGADIVIESGRAHIDVVPVRFRMPGERPWRVNLGPFGVEVNGTRFDVEWSPRTDEFALDLFEGTVRVSGCQDGHSVTLVAGQGVRASCSEQRWLLVSASEAKSLTPASPPNLRAPVAPADEPGAAEPPPSAKPAPDARLPGRPTPRRAPSSAPRSWQALALGGHYSAAFERALDAGFEAECERVTAADLALLGDTARLNGDAARAQAAYLAARRRFGGSQAAVQAAFALGRLTVTSDRSAAIEWFERYLREAPEGPLAPAAHDWLFELVGDSNSPKRRRQLAKNYLEHRPDGAHAEEARRILDANEPR
jgi:transmembrane sensor